MGLIIKAILICSCTLLVISCNNHNQYEVLNLGKYCNDSISIKKIENHISLHIGNKIDPKPLRTQLKYDNDSETYLILDERTIYIFDLHADSLINTIRISECGRLKDYSGFTYLNNDSILIYNYKDKTLRIIDSSSKIYKTYNLQDKSHKISPEALSNSPILINRNKAILSGIPISKAARLTDTDKISVSMNLESGELLKGAHYSDEYSKAFFGGVYFNTIYHTMDHNNRIIYSFPASNYIYRYDTNLSLLDSLYMGSRYTGKIKCSQEPTIKFMSNEEERIKYFAYQDSYSNILHDPFRNIYYRIAEHPSDPSEKDEFPKPFSIIAMNEVGEILSETSILREKYNTDNMHVCRDGLIIQRHSNDENIIQFDLFRFTDKTTDHESDS